jgi:hypothetical protein
MTEIVTQMKKAADVVYFDVKFGSWLAKYGNDTISSLSVKVNDVAISTTTGGLLQPIGRNPVAVAAGTVARLWFAAGVTGTDYKVTVTALTNGGLTKNYDFTVSVSEAQ